ncbi:hypothetical protein AXG93_4720s1120 [Marchantia polymorpha subsp. ruderalis]|uniref:Uncharacterized protein n=1 Tax=Marchantia polymorpha subsp. ruderalis TaxID=1480154 RepID=A0A176VSF0_MARPO|nr:hypothetical protein AXG93_4720s1120 [Marchantia polymorpha subsp. ruderalis]
MRLVVFDVLSCPAKGALAVGAPFRRRHTCPPKAFRRRSTPPKAYRRRRCPEGLCPEGTLPPKAPHIKILETEDDTPSEEEEVESVGGTPTGVLCEQVVPLLRYLDRKATKYGNPRHRGSYVELVRNRTRIKVATNFELMVLDQKYRQLEERYNFLQEQCTISRKLQNAAIQLRDEVAANAQREIEELRAKVETGINSEQAQNRILAEKLVR